MTQDKRSENRGPTAPTRNRGLIATPVSAQNSYCGPAPALTAFLDSGKGRRKPIQRAPSARKTKKVMDLSARSGVLGRARWHGSRARWASFAAGLVSAALFAAALSGVASAAHVARLDVQPSSVEPGGEITVRGHPGFAPAPVTVHWDGLDGPVLATLSTEGERQAEFGPETVTVPADAEPGTYELVAEQEVPEDATPRGVPARARVQVVGPGTEGVASDSETEAASSRTPRLASLQESQPPDGTTLGLIGAGAALLTVVIGLLAGWVVQRGASRRVERGSER